MWFLRCRTRKRVDEIVLHIRSINTEALNHEPPSHDGKLGNQIPAVLA